MHLLLEKRADCHSNNLLTINEVAIIILDEYNRVSFYNIVLAY